MIFTFTQRGVSAVAGAALALAASVLVANAAEPLPSLPEYSLTLKFGVIRYIAEALHEKPYKDVAQILNDIQGQLNAQDKAAADAKAAAEAPKLDEPKQ